MDPNQQPQPNQPEANDQPAENTFNQQPAQPSQPSRPDWQQPAPDSASPYQQPAAPAPVAPNPVAPNPAFGQPAGPAPMPVAPSQENPGKGFGIASIVMIFVFPLLGIVFGFLSRKKSQEAGMPSGLGTAGLIINSIMTVIGIISFIFFVFVIGAATKEMAKDGSFEASGSSSFGTSSLDDEANSLASDAKEVAERAEAYNAEFGDYPKTTSDFEKSSASSIPSEIQVYSSMLMTNSSLTYIYCGAGAAQIVYLGDSKDDKRITALGTASSTEVCAKQL